MTVDTYRYLFSALIQVFGAIIAVGGVFVVWKYNIVQTKLEQLTKRLGILVYFIEKRIERGSENQEMWDARIREDEFLTYESNNIEDIVQKNVKELNESTIGLEEDNQVDDGENKKTDDFILNIVKQNKSSIKRINLYLKKYQFYLKLKKSFSKAIWEIMGIPALLVAILSIGLICTDAVNNSCNRFGISIIAIIISTIALYIVISISSKSFQEERIFEEKD